MLSYKDSGVDIDKGNQLVKNISSSIEKTKRPEVLSGLGGFSGLFSINKLKYEDPILVASTDGIGTKLMLAIQHQKYSGLGQDLVAMCVNDLICCGAEPLFFLDYIATGKLDNQVIEAVIKSMAEALSEINCSLIGGETAEMPGLYSVGHFDCAGFSVGVVNRDSIIDGSNISIGNKIIGLASSGIHSNGYSLVRKIIEKKQLDLSQVYSAMTEPLGDVLLTPTRLYVRSILKLLTQFQINSISHITGGGWYDNIERVLPESCQAKMATHLQSMPPIFQFLKEQGNIELEELFRVFNCGTGLMLIVKDSEHEEILNVLSAMGEEAYLVGQVTERAPGSPSVEIEFKA